jgi:hypothetical protein
MKIDKDIVEQVLCDYIDMATRVKIINDIEREVEQNKPEREKNPKKQFVAIAVTDNPDFEEVPLFIAQIEEGDDHNTIVDRITHATAEHNNTPKGQKFPIDTLGGAMQETKRKFITEKKVWIKSKEPVIIVRSNDNKLNFPTQE